MVMTTGTRRDLVGQAQTDGATRMGVLAHVYIPANWPTVLGGVAVVAALSIADIAACSLVRVPGYGPISLILMDKFHFFEDAMLISLSLWLIAASLPGVLLFTTALKRSL
jgi:ABC-type spermidine/putrescine transport system permease subunit II